ncbi:MAG: TlpA family protein disulfide reductase [Lachnospiraceae bacterium]|nr:TlpA family protein disulfide reductase [Lachnospiraceae bacterium]
MKKRMFLWMAAILLLAGCGADKEPIQQPSVQEQTQEEAADGVTEQTEEAADEPYIVSFEATTIEGEPMNSDIFAQSKLTMINVWATYCNPCLMEMPDLGDIAEEYDKANFQLIGIVSDVVDTASKSDIDNVKELVIQTEANYPHLLLNQSLYENLVGGVSSVPTTFFVNQKGELLTYVVGANDEDTWERIINELLAQEGGPVTGTDNDEREEYED